MKKIIETSARLTLAAALCFGCSRAPNGPSSAESAPAHAEAPGSAKLAPGMCAEHGVLEAVCTKCNPALAAVFKAKGDWCSEHGFPESFCPVCRPEAGGRPATELASDDGPLDGTKVRLATPEAIRAADLRTEVATEAGGERILVVPARIVYDATRVAVVNARAEGVVERLVADVGTQVRRGAALAVLRSAGLGAERSKLQAAQSRLGVAEAALRRVEALHADGIAPERDLLEARREVEAARAEVDASRASLGMVGAPSDEAGTYELRAPLAGVVTKRSASVGQLVGAESSLFEIVDPSKMWAELDIAERDLSIVRPGQQVTLRFASGHPIEVSGPITFIAPELDPKTRTAKARVPVDNPDGALRAQMFGEARIVVPRPRGEVLVPRDAIQRARSVDVVFVRLADDTYEARRVRRSAREGTLVAVTGNVRAGEDIVTQGSFLLKTETIADSIGAGCADDH